MTPHTHPTPPAAPGRAAWVAAASVLLGLGVGAAAWLRAGAEPAQQYLAGYLIELSLSVDNVFVFALVFAHFRVEPPRQRTLLFWGIVGAMLMRTALLAAGLGVIARFAWVIPAFGAVILWTGLRLLRSPRKPDTGDLGQRPLLAFVERHAPAGLAALLVLEAADLVFALDSLPAVMAVTHDLRIAVASNLMAILGLRSLFTVVSGALQRLRHLRHGLSAILCLVGLKMAAEPWYRLSTTASLVAIAAILGACAWASLRAPGRKD